MRIKEFSVVHYGPLRDSGRVYLSNFNLFFGSNEKGKTLTIDALLRMLFGKTIKEKDFKGIDRVEEWPTGYVILETREGKEIKLPQKGVSGGISGIAASDCRNIFFIRDSDLSIDKEGEFYIEVTDKLTGLKTKEISKIKENLRKIGQITQSGIYIDTKEEKIKTRIENARGLIKNIDDLLKSAQEEGFSEFEEESARLIEKMEEILQDIESIENARKREKYQAGERALNIVKESLKKVKHLEIYNQDDEQLWRDCEKDLIRYKEEREGYLLELKGKEGELARINKELKEKEEEFRILDDRKRKIDEEVRPELNNYNERKAAGGDHKQKRVYAQTGILSTILLIISLFPVFYIKPSSLVFYILIFLFLFSTVLLWMLVFIFIKREYSMAVSFKRINLSLSRFGLDAENIEGVNLNIHNFMDKHSNRYENIREITRRADKIKADIERLREDIQKSEGKIKESEEALAQLRRKSKEEKLDDYKEKLVLKKGYEASLREELNGLDKIFGSKGESLGENMEYWDRQIKELEPFRNKAKGLQYSEKAVSDLKDHRDLCNRRLEEIGERLRSFNKDMDVIEKEANKAIGAEYLFCKTLVDLDATKGRLMAFIKEKEENRDTALRNIGIFNEIEAEEKERIIELFGKESPVSVHFSRITLGLYKEVSFNQSAGKVEVIRRDGLRLGAEKLSGGACDQLYLSIRLALGEKLLKGEKGFFIMDDPFVKADFERLKAQIEVLLEISSYGWQIIYFSAKDEVKAVLENNIKKGIVNCIDFH